MSEKKQVAPQPEHILITYATQRPYRTVPDMPEHSCYDPAKGYWLKDGTPLVILDKFTGNGSVSKKCDLETGEDMKGE